MSRCRLVLAVVVALAAGLGSAGPAAAHRLKLFVTVEGPTLSGYGFFIGGGRPQGVAWVVRDRSGAEVHRGTTDDGGGFAWTAPKPDDYVVALDTGDGHFAEETIAADRFSAEAPAATPAVGAAPRVTASTPALACPATLDPAALAAMVEAAAERAVARQLRPLVEAQTLAEGRLRLNDVVGGVGMIVGLAGLALWGMARRREREPRR